MGGSRKDIPCQNRGCPAFKKRARGNRDVASEPPAGHDHRVVPCVNGIPPKKNASARGERLPVLKKKRAISGD